MTELEKAIEKVKASACHGVVLFGQATIDVLLGAAKRVAELDQSERQWYDFVQEISQKIGAGDDGSIESCVMDRLAELERDKARLDWLTAQGLSGRICIDPNLKRSVEIGYRTIQASTVREAIDAAMEGDDAKPCNSAPDDLFAPNENAQESFRGDE